MKISNVASIVNTKIDASILTTHTYISTECMLPNCGGIENCSSIPNGKVTSFDKNDILLSNIRPYFKKLWFSTRSGGCSNDVICLRVANRECLPKYLYYALCTDKFIDSFSASSKGTKMPRGDKNALLTYEIPDRNIEDQLHIVDILGSIDEKIEKLEKENKEFQKLCLSQFKLYFNNKEKVALNKLATVTMGQSPDGNTINESSGTIFYQGRTDFGFRYPEVRLFTSAPKRMSKEGDILLSVRAPVGDVNVAMENCCIGRGLAAISSNYKHFVFYSLLAQQSDFDVYNNTGTIFGSINREALLSFGVPASDMIDVVKFDSLAAIIDSKIKQNVIESIKLKELKALHLQKFFG